MTDFILLLDKRAYDLGARYIISFIGKKLAVAKVWHVNMDCAHSKNA